MTNHEIEELKLVASAEFVARTAGMQFPIEVIAVSANRYFLCATLSGDKKPEITSRSKGSGDAVIMPITLHIFGANGKTARTILGECPECKEENARELTYAS